ncbi:MAG TPA: RNase A-like domain-containing protein [Terriglobales bacterium]|nr:RNase A-like domain-containing protein [Terriglobales bacterium]
MTKFFLVRGAIVRATARAVFALGICVLISCSQPAFTNGASSVATSGAGSASFRVESHPTSGPVRDLGQDEAAGGHILRKHVGQTDDELRARLERERGITGASTYTNRSVAEHAVGAAIAESHDRIERWLSRSGGHPNLVLDYDCEDPIGRSINRGESQSRPCAHALVVLKYVGPNDYYVLTSYPECR